MSDTIVTGYSDFHGSEVPRPGVTAFIGSAALAKLARFVSAGASTQILVYYVNNAWLSLKQGLLGYRLGKSAALVYVNYTWLFPKQVVLEYPNRLGKSAAENDLEGTSKYLTVEAHTYPVRLAF